MTSVLFIKMNSKKSHEPKCGKIKAVEYSGRKEKKYLLTMGVGIDFLDQPQETMSKRETLNQTSIRNFCPF